MDNAPPPSSKMTLVEGELTILRLLYGIVCNAPAMTYPEPCPQGKLMGSDRQLDVERRWKTSDRVVLTQPIMAPLKLLK